jgi:hypothetical protein
VQLLERQVSGAPEIAEGFSDHLVVGDRLRSEILSRAFARAIDARWHRTLVALQRVYHLSSITDLGAVSEAHSKAVAELSRLEQEANNVLRKMGFVPLTINFLEPVSEQVRLFADLCDEAPVARYYPLARLGKEQVVLNVRRWPFLDEAGHLRRRGELVVSRSE